MIASPRWLHAVTCALVLLPALPACAKQPQAPAPQAEHAKQTPTSTAAPDAIRPGLWKIADADTTIWLFGTIHILPENLTWYSGPVAAAFEKSDELVTEIPIEENAQAAGIIVEASKRKDGKTLRATLPDALRVRYEAGMASLGLPPQVFDANETWFAALMLTMIPLKTAGYNTESGVDAQVAARATARHMRNVAFESAEYQIGLFKDLPEATQRAYLDEVLDALPTVKTDIDAMVTAWKTGNADQLAKLLNEDESDPQMRKVLLTDRNAAWAKWLKARLDKPGTVFVAVGAGHLAGPGSVQDDLKAAGISSTRVQ
ncbi:TraB/GumN family protein [Novosphingobium sp. Rr 2-17]|uniref:TraB/GumN family protein n=1 Tax=Novosphingobium sp. Rr 2-17 TaxID=555793 RepID=UPI0005B7FA8C|nr:TraB/GumN family protein [Novosphingobium sp. Rr 2-17]